jgi:hypothetical protein
MATTYAMIAERVDVAMRWSRTISRRSMSCLAPAPVTSRRWRRPWIGTPSTRAIGTEPRVDGQFGAPWMRGAVHEAALVPELRGLLGTTRDRLQFNALALAPRFGKLPPAALVGLFETFLISPTPHQGGRAQRPEAGTATVDALHAVTRLYDSKTKRRTACSPTATAARASTR